jgi:cytochrome c oxidase subunit 2
MPDPATEEAPRILHLWQGSWIAALAVGAVVWGLIVWSVIFYRRRSAEVPPQVRFNVPIEALYTAVPFIIISVLFYFVARDETKLLELPDNPDQTINVVGRQWSWSFNYLDEDVWDAGTPGQPPTRADLARRHPLVLGAELPVQDGRHSRAGQQVRHHA